jgi:hypothetical protein
MTGLRWLAHVGLVGSRKLLHWMSILLLSIALTYAINEALTGSWATPYWWPAVAIASRVSEGRVADTVAYQKAVEDLRGSCTSLFGSYNFWLFDEDSRGPCGLAVADGADPTSSNLRVSIEQPQ